MQTLPINIRADRGKLRRSQTNDRLPLVGRPANIHRKMARANTEKAVLSGKTTAAEVARMTFDAVRGNRFFVFTHPKILASVRERFEAALAGDPPTDPLAARPGGTLTHPRAAS